MNTTKPAKKEKRSYTPASKKPKNFFVQYLIRFAFIFFIHLVGFLIGGLLLGVNVVVRLIVGILVELAILAFLFFIARSDGDKDYAILAANQKAYYNSAPFREKALGYAPYKGIIVASVSLLPAIILHIVVLFTKNFVVKGLVTFFFCGPTLVFSGMGVLDTAGVLAGSNFGAYAVIMSVAIVLSIAAYAVGYFVGGNKRVVFHRQVVKEQRAKTRDW